MDGPEAGSLPCCLSSQSQALPGTPTPDGSRIATGCAGVALLGNASFSLSVAALALTNGSSLLVYAIYACVGITGTLCSCVLLAKPIPLWFSRHRGLLFALTSAFGINIGIALLPFMVIDVMRPLGWRAAYVSLGAVTFLVGSPAIVLLRVPRVRKPEAAALGADGLTARQARRLPEFWLLMSAVALGAGSLSAMLTHMVPLLTDRGFPLRQAATVFAVTALCNASWQLVIGIMLDRSRSPRFCGIFLVMAVAGLALVASAHQVEWLLAGAVLIGIGSGTEYGLLPYVIQRYFGGRSFSETYGMIFGVAMFVAGFTPFLMGAAYDHFHNYNVALAVIGIALVCSAIQLGLMPRYRHVPQQDDVSVLTPDTGSWAVQGTGGGTVA